MASTKLQLAKQLYAVNTELVDLRAQLAAAQAERDAALEMHQEELAAAQADALKNAGVAGECFAEKQAAERERDEAIAELNRARPVLKALEGFKDEWIEDLLCDAIETPRGLNPRVKAFVKVFEALKVYRAAKEPT